MEQMGMVADDELTTRDFRAMKTCDLVSELAARGVRPVRQVRPVRKSRENRKKSMKCNCIIVIKHYIITITGKRI
jgi:hypothetical protein